MSLLCPTCYEPNPATAAACAHCGAAIWIDDRVAIASPMTTRGRAHAGVYRGWLRDGDGESNATAIVVKIFDRGAARDWREHDRFTAQRDVLGALGDLPVPRALGDWQRAGRVYHCQSLLAGRPLDASYPIEVLPSFARQLLLLLDAMHRRGIVHRDLKPEHILVTDDGVLQLIDFGAVGWLADEHRAVPTVVGTPGFMAPEQLLGEWGIESDLYAAGKVIEHALAGRTEPRIEALVRRLTHADRQRRPRSGAAAAALLDARRRWPMPAAALATPVLCGLALLLGRGHSFHHEAAPAPSAIAATPPPLAQADLDRPARQLLAAWERAQNTQDFASYSALYAETFTGTLRTANGATRTLDHKAWLASRAAMFVPTLQVAAEEVIVRLDPNGTRATLSFVQRFRTARYVDHGRKEIVVEQTDRLRIVTERMLDSHLGWDEADQRRRFPAHGATCDTAFDPSDARFVIALGHFDDYRDALRAAGQARRRGTEVELVWGEDFVELARGYWLLSGVTDDATEARTIAATTHGRVWRVHAAAPQLPSVLRRIAERRVASEPALVTTTTDTVYVVNAHEASALVLRGDELAELFRLPMPRGSRPIRVAVREGHAYVLDASGHWSLIAPGGIVRTRSFDPEPEGHVAIFGAHRFEIEADALVYRRNEGESHRLPLASSDTGIWRLGADRLVLLRESKLVVFAVGDTPRRLTKVCGAIDGELTGPAHVTIGAIDLDTDREGGFELWSSQWGFFAPALEATATCTPPNDDCSSSSTVTNLIEMLGQPRVELEGAATCECSGC